MAEAVIDLQYGDCGKGKVVKYLSDNHVYDYCVKFIGGANAGHTVYHKGVKHVGHQVPSVMVNNVDLKEGEKGIICVIGCNCYVDLVKLDEELKELEKLAGKSLRQYMKIAYNAHVTLEKHILDDKANDMSGSTHCGIRPTARDKYDRCGTRICDVAEDGEVIGCEVVDVFELLNAKKNKILFEGSQGFWLDVNWGKYPFITSSDTTISSIISTGVPFSSLDKIWGVAKIYETYVGSDVFQSDDPRLVQLQEKGNEFGATTGRPRQCGWLDLTKLRKPILINDVTHLVFNKCDIIKELNFYNLYMDGKLIEYDTFDEMRSVITDYVRSIKSDIIVIFSGNKDGL